MKNSSGKNNYEALILLIGILIAVVAFFDTTSVKGPEVEFTTQAKAEVTAEAIPVEQKQLQCNTTNPVNKPM